MYDAAYLPALSALAGSMVGGLTSGLTTWLSLRNQARAGQLAHDLSRRDDLYKDFIVAASKAYGDAMLSNEPQMQDLVALYAMISRMRVLSSARTVACAQKVVEATVDTYFAPNKTIREKSYRRSPPHRAAIRQYSAAAPAPLTNCDYFSQCSKA